MQSAGPNPSLKGKLDMVPIPNSCFSVFRIPEWAYKAKHESSINVNPPNMTKESIVHGEWKKVRVQVSNNKETYKNQSLTVEIIGFVTN